MCRHVPSHFNWTLPSVMVTMKYKFGRMWGEVVVGVLFRNLHVACGLRIEFKNFCLQAGVLATELWHLVPICTD
jgi:hypothetical protein